MTTSLPQPDDNFSYTKLKRGLEADAILLNFLPYKRATFHCQNEVEQAAPERILYGDMMEEKDQLWIYFTLHNKVLFYTLKGAQGGQNPVQPSIVKQAALASWPFTHARDQFEIMAIAKYFFIRRGIDAMLKFPIIVTQFKDDLVRACHNYQTMYNQTQVTRKVPGKTGSMFAATPTGPSAHGLRNSSQTASIETSRKRAHSSSSSYDNEQESGRSSIQFPTPPTSQVRRQRLSSADREAMIDEYISLQTREEELDNKIGDVEKERSGLAAQVAELQADLNAVTDRKWDLTAEKGRIEDQKKRLQSPLDLEERLEFGFEAGRKMESKRLRKE